MNPRPRAFFQAYASGYHPGGLAGIGATAEYLRWLGVDALITQPVNRFPAAATDRYYSPSDHGTVDASFGGESAIQDLNRTLREHGITPVGDLVADHVDRSGWVVDRSIQHPKQYGTWLRVSHDPVAHHWPDRLVNIFGEDQWTDVAGLGAVATPFYPDQYALNLARPDVVDYLLHAVAEQMLKAWGYGGLRIDAFASIDPIDLTDAPAVNAHGRVAPHPVALAFLDRLRAEVLAPLGSWAIAEAGGSPEYMRALMAHESVDYAYDVSWWGVLLHAIDTGRWDALRGHIAGQDPAKLGQHIRYLGSHDERQARFLPQREELIARHGGTGGEFVCFDGNGLTRRMRDMVPDDDAHALALGLTFTMPGVPLCFQGDMEGLRGDSTARALDVRDPNRCRMPWDARQENAGWGGVASPYPLDPDWRTRSVAQQRRDPRSMLARARRLLYLRQELPSLVSGDYIELKSSHAATFAFSRSAEGAETVIVVANATGRRVSTDVDLGPSRQGQRLTTLDSGPVPTGDAWPVQWGTLATWENRADHTVTLAPYELRIIRVVNPAPREAR
jgi:oligo-1,6-glucosidase